MSASRALVTGGTGLVGTHIVRRLLDSGWDVRVLARPASVLPTSGDVEVERGDILDRDAFERAAAGRDVIFHTAAAISAKGGWESFRRPNIDGTANAIAAAERSGARLVQLSSVAVYDARYGRGSEKINEDVPLGPIAERSFYARSKRESEAMVLAAHAAGRIWATAVRPVVIYGAGDRLFVPRVARILRWGVAPVFRGGRAVLPIVHAANVADGTVLAATHDAAGGRAYNLSNDFDVTARNFYRMAAEGLGRRVRLVPVSASLASLAVKTAIKLLELVSGGSTIVSQDTVEMMTHDNPFTSERARRELGWSPLVRPEDGIPEAFRWWSVHRNERA